MIRSHIIAVGTSATLLATAPLSAGALNSVIPGAYADTPGTGSFVGPMAVAARTYQLLVHESLLTDLVGRDLTGIAWRLPANATSPWPGVDLNYGTFDIYLSGAVAPSDRSLTFSENVVGPQTQVRTGGLSVDAGDFSFGGSPNQFGSTIGFDAWSYTGGHLLVEIRHSGNGVASRALDALSTSTPGYNDLFSAVWSSGIDAESGFQGNFTIFQFTSIPAPATMVLGAMGLLGVGGRRRRA